MIKGLKISLLVSIAILADEHIGDFFEDTRNNNFCSNCDREINRNLYFCKFYGKQLN